MQSKRNDTNVIINHTHLNQVQRHQIKATKIES